MSKKNLKAIPLRSEELRKLAEEEAKKSQEYLQKHPEPMEWYFYITHFPDYCYKFDLKQIKRINRYIEEENSNSAVAIYWAKIPETVEEVRAWAIQSRDIHNKEGKIDKLLQDIDSGSFHIKIGGDK